MKKWVLILLMLLLTFPGYALITIEKKPGTGTLSGHLDDINANDLELDGKIADKVSDDAFTVDWAEVTDVAPSQAALYNYLINFDADGDGLFSDEAWFPSIFDPAAPGEIGGTTPAAGTFTDLTADTLTLTSVDGENRLTFPDNTTRSPAAGAQEIYSEGGLMKYSENGVEKNFVTIDDTAGAGDTNVTLSADKIVEYIAAGGAGVPDGTSTNDILSWDGDSWEPIALTDHPAFASLLTAFNNAGLNSFSFDPVTTFPLWIDGDGTTLSVDVTDTSTAYAVDTVAYQLDGVGGFVNSLTNTTGDIWTAAFNPATDGTYTVQYQASDDKETPNIGTSSVYTIYRDATAPSVEAGEATTHDGAGTAVEFAPTISDDNLVSKSYKVTSEDGNTTVTDWTTFATSTVDVTLPSTMNNYRIYARGTDHLQSTDDYLVASYSGESETTYMLQETTVFTSTRAADSGLFGQSFTIASGQGGVCTGVVFKAAEGTVTADTTVTVRICNTPGTINMETDYASGSVVLTSGFSGLFTVPITSGPTLAVGSVYAVAGHVSHTMGIEFSATGDAYTGGTMYATTATDWDLTGHQDPYDCVFGYVVSQ